MRPIRQEEIQPAYALVADYQGKAVRNLKRGTIVSPVSAEGADPFVYFDVAQPGAQGPLYIVVVEANSAGSRFEFALYGPVGGLDTSSCQESVPVFMGRDGFPTLDGNADSDRVIGHTLQASSPKEWRGSPSEWPVTWWFDGSPRGGGAGGTAGPAGDEGPAGPKGDRGARGPVGPAFDPAYSQIALETGAVFEVQEDCYVVAVSDASMLENGSKGQRLQVVANQPSGFKADVTESVAVATRVRGSRVSFTRVFPDLQSPGTKLQFVGDEGAKARVLLTTMRAGAVLQPEPEE